jgi:hypothetical protein
LILGRTRITNGWRWARLPWRSGGLIRNDPRHSAVASPVDGDERLRLVEEIRALILADPRRYDQTIYIAPSWGDNQPDCETTGCRAGWAVILKAPRPWMIGSHYDYAKRLLGLTEKQASELFNMGAAKGVPGTKEHAVSGAKGITTFLRKHKAQLQAKRV